MISGSRIVIVFGTFQLGGAERQALLLARYLKNNSGAVVQVWGFQIPGRVSQICDEYGIPWQMVSIKLTRNPVQLLMNLIEYGRKLKNERPDIILSYTIFPNVICGLIWKMTGAKIYIWNQRDAGIQRFVNKIMERIAVFNTRHFVSNSDQGADFLIKTFALSSRKVQVIHNGVELNSPGAGRLEWRARLGVSEKSILACMVANLSVLKDHATLLKAWRVVIGRLGKNDQNVYLLLAGRLDQEYQMLKDLSQRLDLGESIRFLGQVEDVPGLLGAVDLGVFSSFSEGMPNGVLECMAAGLPVAGSDIPGIREVVGQEGFAYLAPAGDAEALAERILLLLGSPELRVQAGRSNKQRIVQEFALNRMCKETADFMSQLIEN